jgi:hypothetical protein
MRRQQSSPPEDRTDVAASTGRRGPAIGLLAAGLATGMIMGGASPAAAQGDPVAGKGNVYYLSGALNNDGQAQAVFTFGDPGDEVYFGDWYGSGVDLPLVRRGNTFYVPDQEDPSLTADEFSYGNAGDAILVGDWDGDGVDSLAVRRGNEFFLKNDNQQTGVAERTVSYANPGDKVLVGNWYGALISPTRDPRGYGKGDSLMVQRGNQFFVRTDLTTGPAHFTFFFGDPGDDVLVGNWAPLVEMAHPSADWGDQLAVRRGNQYFRSSEISELGRVGGNPRTDAWFFFGNSTDNVFVASLPTALDVYGEVTDDLDAADLVVEGDGMGVRR